MKRRDILAASAVLGAATMAMAADAPKAATPAAADEATLASSVAACLTAAYACRAHCLGLLTKGDKSIAGCANAVAQMIPLCEAVAALAPSNSKHMKKLAAAAADACTDCEAECRKHENHHAQCKACADACKACIDFLKKAAA